MEDRYYATPSGCLIHAWCRTRCRRFRTGLHPPPFRFPHYLTAQRRAFAVIGYGGLVMFARRTF